MTAAKSVALSIQLTCTAVVLSLYPVPASSQSGTIQAYADSPPVSGARYIKRPLVVYLDSTSPAVAASESRTMTGAVPMYLRAGGNLARHALDTPAATPPDKIGKWTNAWFTNAAAEEQNRFAAFINTFFAAGGKVNYILVDDESSITAWSTESANNEAIWNDNVMVNGSLRNARFRTLLSQYSSAAAATDWWTPQPTAAICDWNAAYHQLFAEAVRTAYYAPARNKYPAVRLSNYEDHIMSKSEALNALASTTRPEYSNNVSGTHMAPAFYGYIQNAGNLYGVTPFEVLRWEISRMRAMKRSSSVPISPWFPYKAMRYGVYYQQPRYQEELIYHLVLNGATELLYFNPRPWLPSQDPNEWANDAQDQEVDGYLAVLNSKFTGSGSRSALSTSSLIPWDGSLFASGMRASNGIRHWRVTVAPGVTRIRVTPANISLNIPPGSGGVWYATTTSVTPTFTVEATGN